MTKFINTSKVSHLVLCNILAFYAILQLKVEMQLLLMPVLLLYEPRHDISYIVVCAPSKGSDQPEHTRSLISAFASRLNNL